MEGERVTILGKPLGARSPFAEKEQLQYEERYDLYDVYSGSVLIILMPFPEILRNHKILQIFLSSIDDFLDNWSSKPGG